MIGSACRQLVVCIYIKFRQAAPQVVLGTVTEKEQPSQSLRPRLRNSFTRSLCPFVHASLDQHTIGRNVNQRMIRRNPTLLPIQDSDVQALKDLVAARKERDEGANGDTPSQKDAPQLPFVAAEDAKRKREALTTEERLGIAQR